MTCIFKSNVTSILFEIQNMHKHVWYEHQRRGLCIYAVDGLQRPEQRFIHTFVHCAVNPHSPCAIYTTPRARRISIYLFKQVTSLVIIRPGSRITVNVEYFIRSRLAFYIKLLSIMQVTQIRYTFFFQDMSGSYLLYLCLGYIKICPKA